MVIAFYFLALSILFMVINLKSTPGITHGVAFLGLWFAMFASVVAALVTL